MARLEPSKFSPLAHESQSEVTAVGIGSDGLVVEAAAVVTDFEHPLPPPSAPSSSRASGPTPDSRRRAWRCCAAPPGRRAARPCARRCAGRRSGASRRNSIGQAGALADGGGAVAQRLVQADRLAQRRPQLVDVAAQRVELALEHLAQAWPAPRAAAGSSRTARSTICVWKIALANACAGPSCSSSARRERSCFVALRASAIAMRGSASSARRSTGTSGSEFGPGDASACTWRLAAKVPFSIDVRV